MKAKFGKIKVKKNNGFIDTELVAYVDITKIAKNLFDNVKRAILIQNKFYDDIPLEEWKESQREIASKIDSNSKALDIDAAKLIIEFSSGKVTSFRTSEWGEIFWDKMPELG